MEIGDKVLVFVLVVASVILHEVAHGYVAWRLGDPTARMHGRITLNPLAHIDLFGTILVPFLLSLTGGPVLGWAKPVPFNPSFFRDPKRDIMLTGAAGPASNFAVAVLAALLIAAVRIGFPAFPPRGVMLLATLCMVNVYLGLFNLIPIPPLDGSRVAIGLMPDEWVAPYLRLERFGFLILFGLLYLNAIDWFLNPLAGWILDLLL